MEMSSAILRRSVAILFLGLAAFALHSCGGKPKKPPTVEKTRLDAQVIAAQDVNQDKAGRSLPIVVRIYELKTLGGIQSADFYSLYDREAEALGADLVAREELNLRPGQQHQIKRETAPETLYLGVMGAFKAIDSAQWKAVHPLAPGKENKIEIHLGPNAVSIR